MAFIGDFYNRALRDLANQGAAQASAAPIPGVTGPTGTSVPIPGVTAPTTQLPGLPPQGMRPQPMGFDPQQYLAGLASRINGPAAQPQGGMPQGLMALLQSNPNVRRFTGGR